MGLGSFTGFAVGVSIVFFGVYLITSASLSGAPMTSPLQVPEVRRGDNIEEEKVSIYISMSDVVTVIAH